MEHDTLTVRVVPQDSGTNDETQLIGQQEETLTGWIAAVFSFLSAIRISIISVPIGTLAGIVAAPMWLPSLRRFRGATVLAITILVAVAWGIILTVQQAPFNGGTSTSVLIAFSFLSIFILTGYGTLLWAREHLNERAIALAAGAGLLLTNILNGSAFSATDPWKFGLGLPISVLVLALALGTSRWQVTLGALIALAGTNALLDSRSAFATCVLAAFLFVAQRYWSRGTRASLKSRIMSLLLVVLTAAIALYQITSHLLMAGYLGEEAQQRSRMQQELSLIHI